jgi:hypothetical protein
MMSLVRSERFRLKDERDCEPGYDNDVAAETVAGKKGEEEMPQSNPGDALHIIMSMECIKAKRTQ